LKKIRSLLKIYVTRARSVRISLLNRFIIKIVHGKNGFAEKFKILAEYRLEN